MISKFQIYDYWKDKAITKNFDVKCTCDCSDADEAISITEFDDEIFCWACGMLPYRTSDSEKLSTYWNQDRLLEKAHILARSKGGDDIPANLFLLCPSCHAESPDTTNPKNFFAWVYYKRKHENCWQTIPRELERAAMMKGISVEEIQSRISALDLDIKKIELLRKKLQERCALHGSSISMSSKMMSMIDILMEDSDLVAGAPD